MMAAVKTPTLWIRSPMTCTIAARMFTLVVSCGCCTMHSAGCQMSSSSPFTISWMSLRLSASKGRKPFVETDETGINSSSWEPWCRPLWWLWEWAPLPWLCKWPWLCSIKHPLQIRQWRTAPILHTVQWVSEQAEFNICLTCDTSFWGENNNLW